MQKNVKNFTIGAFGNKTASWTIAIPEGLQGVQYKILAKAGNFSDGEENILPVLTNNMLVTESIPIWVRENSKKEYTFENLKNNNSTTLKNPSIYVRIHFEPSLDSHSIFALFDGIRTRMRRADFCSFLCKRFGFGNYFQ